MASPLNRYLSPEIPYFRGNIAKLSRSICGYGVIFSYKFCMGQLSHIHVYVFIYVIKIGTYLYVYIN